MGYLQLWMRYLSDFLWTHSWDVGTLVTNNSKVLTWNSYISVLPGLNLFHLNTIVSLVGHLLRPLVLFSYTRTHHNLWRVISVGDEWKEDVSHNQLVIIKQFPNWHFVSFLNINIIRFNIYKKPLYFLCRYIYRMWLFCW